MNNGNKDSLSIVRSDERITNIQNLLISSLNALGPIGGGFATALSNYLTDKRIKRIEEVLTAMNGRYEQITDRDFEGLITSDQFQQLFISVLEKAQNEHNEEKRKRYGIMIANISATQNFDYNLCEHFIRLLSDMNDLHFAIVMELAKNGVCQKESSGWTNFSTLSTVCSELSPAPEREIIASALQELAFYGIIKSRGDNRLMLGTNPIGLWYGSSYSMTATGERFLEYLNSENNK